MINFIKEAKKIENTVIKWRRELHKIPEIGLETTQTCEFIKDKLDKMGIDYKTGYARNGLVALIKKEENKYSDYKTFAIRTDMDGLKIKEKTNLNFESEHEGKMHACGHDAHMAIALGAIKIISENIKEFEGNIKVIFQPGEEGAGGAKKMIQDGALINPSVDAIIGLHVGGLFDEINVGEIGISTGPTMACIDKFKIKIIGEGGHGALPNKTIDPIVIAASIIGDLQSLISRELSPVKPGVISVGKIEGGESFNIIPDIVELEGTARFIHKKERKEISRRMEELTHKAAESRKADLSFEYEFGSPPLINPKEFAIFLKNCAINLFERESIVNIKKPIMVGEDMSYYLNEIPGNFFFLGANKKINGVFHQNHSSKFDIQEKVLWKGVALFLKASYQWLKVNS